MSDTELLTTRDALSSIADEWRALAEEVGNVFVTPEWLVTWLEHGVERVTPFVVTRRGDDGRLCGVLPLVLVAGRRPVLRFAGASVGDWFGPVIKTGEEAAFIRGAAAILGRESGSWSMLALTNVDAEAAWPSQLSDAMPRRTFVGGTSTGMPYIDLSLTTWDQYLKGRSSKLRAQLGRSMRVLRRDHDVTFRRTKSPSDVARDVETLFDLHNRRWNKRGGSGIPPVTHSFHERFAQCALQRDWLRLWFLEIDGTPVAAWYGWRFGGRYAFYLGGFDPVWAQRGTGILLLAHTIQEAFSEGSVTYDFLLGDEEYKMRFAHGRRFVRTSAVVPSFGFLRVVIATEMEIRRLGRVLPPGVHARTRRAAGPMLRRLPTAKSYG